MLKGLSRRLSIERRTLTPLKPSHVQVSDLRCATFGDQRKKKTLGLAALGTLVFVLGCAAQATGGPSKAPSDLTALPSREPNATETPKPNPSPLTAEQAISEAISAPDRSEADRALDSGRHPKELLQFFGIAPGWRVAELAAGGGYTAELLARLVGPKGLVFGQNSPFLLERFAEKPWSERLRAPAMQNVVRVDRDFDSPLPPSASDLDAVLLILFYHDTVWMKADRAKMNANVFRALKPGGVYGVVDHSARAGVGLDDVETLHRIEKSIVVHEVQNAGFVLEAEADFLQNAADTRDWSASPRTAGEKRGTSDRFVLRFRKPASIACAGPRPTQCSDFEAPACGLVDTGIRCIVAPCPSSENRSYLNACKACADPAVQSFTRGSCPASAR
jgi:predicted methyltransferase